MSQLHNGDCFEVMQGLADNSVDLVLTDPPSLLEIGIILAVLLTAATLALRAIGD